MSIVVVVAGSRNGIHSSDSVDTSERSDSSLERNVYKLSACTFLSAYVTLLDNKCSVSVLIFAHVERFRVSRMRYF